MSHNSTPHHLQCPGLNAFEKCVRKIAEIVRQLLIIAGVETNPGPALKCKCCSRLLGKSTKKLPTIWCHVCGWVHFKCSGLQDPSEYQKFPIFRCSWCSKNTRLVPDDFDRSLLTIQDLYTNTSNAAAFGSRQALINQATPKGIRSKKVDEFLSHSETYTKFRAARSKFTRLKVQAYRINEIWSGDLADVHQLAKDNDGKNFLLVFVDCLSRFLRVEPINRKSAIETKNALEKMMTRKQRPEKIWVDKGKEFKGEFAKLCLEKNIVVYNTHSEMKSCFAERYIRTLKSILFKYLHENNTGRYIDQLHKFVNLINSRPNRITKIAPKKVTQHDVPYLISLAANANPIKKPRYKIGDTVRIRLKIPTFHKGYKIQFTEEVFEITGNPTLNPPTYNIKDKNNQVIEGKFYEPELVLFRYN